MTRAIFFRGRNTAAIVNDARLAGIVPDEATITIVARQDDALAEPGDVTDVPNWHAGDDVRIVANGGTSAQLVPVIVCLAQAAERADAEADEYLAERSARRPPRTWRWSVFDVQRDGVTKLAGD